MAGQDTLDRLIKVTEEYVGNRPANLPLGPESAISQDAYIFGVDVDDYVEVLDSEFGPVVWQIPWLQFTDQSDSYRGCAVGLFSFILIGRVIAWPFTRASFLKVPRPKAFPNRLELAHIAAVIDR